MKTKSKHSLGALYKFKRTNEKSPQLTGQLKLLRHTFDAIAEKFDQCDGVEVVCDIAAWHNIGKQGEDYLTVQLSPPYAPCRRRKTDIFRWLKDE